MGFCVCLSGCKVPNVDVSDENPCDIAPLWLPAARLGAWQQEGCLICLSACLLLRAWLVFLSTYAGERGKEPCNEDSTQASGEEYWR